MATFDPITLTLRDSTPVEIRHARPEEAAAGVDYQAELYSQAGAYLITQGSEYERDIPAYAERLGKTLTHPRSVHLFAWSDGRVIGDAVFQGGSKARDRHTGWFGVGVRPDWQGLGLGRVLLRAILDWAAAHQDIERVTLRVFAENARAIALYRSFGFVEEGGALRAFKLEDGTYADDLAMCLYVKPGVAPPGFGTYAPSPVPDPTGTQ